MWAPFHISVSSFIKEYTAIWSLWFGQFCHFSPYLKLFKSGSLWFHFYCHFSAKLKNSLFLLLQLVYFVLLCRGIFVQLLFI
ncbi:hypothetical protein Hanom_Chr10g00891511 [Helianthus anomalus]